MASSGGINSKKLFPRNVEPGRSLNSMAESSGEWFVRQSFGSNSITASQVTRSKLPAALNSSATLSQWTCGKWGKNNTLGFFADKWGEFDRRVPKEGPYNTSCKNMGHLRLNTLPDHWVHEDGKCNHSTKRHCLSQKPTSRDVMRIMGSMLLNSCRLCMVWSKPFRYERWPRKAC